METALKLVERLKIQKEALEQEMEGMKLDLELASGAGEKGGGAQKEDEAPNVRADRRGLLSAGDH